MFREAFWYTLTMMANAALSLLVVPVTIYVAGAAAWGAIAVGQSIGSVATIFVALGWGYNGPTLVAQANEVQRKTIAINSIVARLIVAPVLAVLGALLAFHLAPTIPGGAVLAGLTVTLAGLGMSWYFIGEGQPKRLFFLDGLPRWLGNVAGVAALYMWHDVYLFLWIQFAGSLVSILISAIDILNRGVVSPAGVWNIRSAFAGVKNQMYAGITVITATSFASLPMLVIAAISPSHVPIYALGERLVRFALMAITPFFQWAQGWVGKIGSSRSMKSKIRIASRASYIIAFPVGILVAFCGPFAGQVLSTGRVSLPIVLTIAFGTAVIASTISRVIGMACLLALGDDRSVAISATIGAVIGVPLLFLLTNASGATGAAASLAISEVLVVCYQLIALRRREKTALAVTQF